MTTYDRKLLDGLVEIISKVGWKADWEVAQEALEFLDSQKVLYTGDDRHQIKFKEDGDGEHTIMHPLTCRPNLFDCPFADAVGVFPLDDDIDFGAKYYVTLDKYGYHHLGEKVPDDE
jgi:hypothetical protein